MAERVVSHTKFVAAPAEEIFALLQDPAKHAEIDGSDTVQASRGEPERLEMGSKFGMDMKFGPIPYRMSNTVVEFEQDRLITWRHFGRHRWRWELEPVEGGTNVTESFDWSTSIFPKGIELMGYPKTNGEGIEKTLDGLAARYES